MSMVVGKDNWTMGNNRPLVFIGGPCVLEDLDISLDIAEYLKELTSRIGMPFIFKASFDKANRTSIQSFRGPGLQKGLKILEQVKTRLSLPILSDIHDVSQVEPAAEILDIIQIPAFLCRQTDLLAKVAKTQACINVKKGQFLAPWDMEQVIKKITENGNQNILLTERGTSFGYNNLVVDMRGLQIMRDLGFPVIFDATHSVQLPGGSGNCSGGQREFVPLLARAAVAAGVDGVFMEVYPDPEKARCDGANSVYLDRLEPVLRQMMAIHKIHLSG
ncbi:2-dehydro-3-deoxyphosphooctonate aldolase [Candidatus Magnetomorum sp. HK-1]|nr:2-dehydro-3-deoxyphosphooctonate aldolase [Candidatus Magnetomorum sp. HK-1]